MGLSNVIQLFGGLGVFIYGMKLMSESLEKAAGNNLKSLLSSMTSNRFFGVFTGFLITCIIQSSSATTVMVVGFVNAGLLNLAQSIGIIMGANIGTTLTAWIVNLTNIKFNITLFSYFMVIFGILFLFLKNKKLNIWGNVFIGFAFLFIGLYFLKESIHRKSITDNMLVYNFFQSFPADKYWTYFVFIGIGTLFTIILQSSSATMAFTITLISQNYIQIEHAAAMVLGENIGTTFTAILASLAGNRMSKKAALAHSIFNIFGVTWMMLPFVFPNVLKLSRFFGENSHGGVQLAIFHSLFNITNTFILVWFVPQFVILVNYLFGPEKEKKKLVLSNIKFGLIHTPDLALLEAQNEVGNMAHLSYKMFDKTRGLFSGTKIQKAYPKIKNMEQDIDDYEGEIYSFLIDLLREDTSVQTTDKINILLDEIRNLEWIGDSCEMIADLIQKAHDNNYEMPAYKEEQFIKIQSYLDNFFKLFIDNINNLEKYNIIKEGLKFESNINTLYKKLKKKSISNMKSTKKNIKKNVASGLLFMDIIKELEHIGDALKNIISSYNEKRAKTLKNKKKLKVK